MVKDDNPDISIRMPKIKHIKFLADDFDSQDIFDKVPKLNKIVIQACHAKGHSDLEGKLEEARSYIKENPSELEKMDDTENTPLIVSAQLQKPQVTGFLLSQGAKINAQDRHGNSSLNHFINHGCEEGVELLLDNGVDLTKKNNHGQNALHIAATNINNNKESDSEEPNITQMLIAKSRDLEVKDSEGRTAADLAYKYGNNNTLKTLLESGARAPDTSEVKFDSYVNLKKKRLTQEVLRSRASPEGGEESKEAGHFVDNLMNDGYKLHHHRSHHISDLEMTPKSMKIYVRKTCSSRDLNNLFNDGETKTNCR